MYGFLIFFHCLCNEKLLKSVIINSPSDSLLTSYCNSIKHKKKQSKIKKKKQKTKKKIWIELTKLMKMNEKYKK